MKLELVSNGSDNLQDSDPLVQALGALAKPDAPIELSDRIVGTVPKLPQFGRDNQPVASHATRAAWLRFAGLGGGAVAAGLGALALLTNGSGGMDVPAAAPSGPVRLAVATSSAPELPQQSDLTMPVPVRDSTVARRPDRKHPRRAHGNTGQVSKDAGAAPGALQNSSNAQLAAANETSGTANKPVQGPPSPSADDIAPPSFVGPRLPATGSGTGLGFRAPPSSGAAGPR